MPERIKFSPEALAIVTRAQCERILALSDKGRHSIAVLTAFDLPTGFVAFQLTYAGDRHSPPIYGGISPDGVAST